MKPVLARIKEMREQGRIFLEINLYLTGKGVPPGEVIDMVDGSFVSQEYSLNIREFSWSIDGGLSSDLSEFSLGWRSDNRNPETGYIIEVRTADLATRGKPEIWHGWERGTPEAEKDPAIAGWAERLLARYTALSEWSVLTYVNLFNDLFHGTRDEAWEQLRA